VIIVIPIMKTMSSRFNIRTRDGKLLCRLLHSSFQASGMHVKLKSLMDRDELMINIHLYISPTRFKIRGTLS
jgi:hypothetical protein